LVVVAADIVVVLDASKAMGQSNFRVAKEIVKIIFTATGISHRGVKGGFIITSKRARIVFGFRRCNSVLSMTKKVKRVKSFLVVLLLLSSLVYVS
jgi:hypothetical protein